MKIAFILGAFPTLSETFILNQITGLIDRGHEVDIFARSRGRDSKVHEDVLKYGLLQRTFYRPAMPRNKFKRLLKGLYLFVTNFHRNPAALVRSLNIFKYGKEAANLRLLYAAIPFVGKGPYDIIQAHFGSNGVLADTIRRLGAIQGKLITSFHGYDMSSYLSRNHNRIYEQLFASGDLFLPISEFWHKKLIELGCSNKKVLVHRMGVRIGDGKSLQAKESVNKEKTEILSIARLVEKKGIEYGIRAVGRLKDMNYKVEYKIAGNGHLRKEFEELVRDLSLQDTVFLLGSKSKHEIDTLLKSANILLAPSVTGSDGDQEGIPVAIMEAMAAGVPVVSTLHSGIPELVTDGKTGFLVPERDVDALAEKLIYLIEHPEIWPEMGRAGRARVEANYDINKLNDRLVEIYRNLTDGR